MMTEDCFVCRKLRGEAGIPDATVFRDELAHAGHLGGSTDDVGLYAGHLVVEPVRHAPSWAYVTSAEAADIGRLIRACAAALITMTSADRIYTTVLGHAVDHLHVHVIPRHPGTPDEFAGPEVTSWEGAPRVDAVGAIDLARRLRPIVAAEMA